MIIKNAKIFDGEKFIGENAVVLKGKFIRKIVDFSLIDEKELENQEVIDGENLDDSEVSVGKKGQKTIEFASEGYSFIIALNDDGTIDANSPAGVFSLDAEATPVENAP